MYHKRSKTKKECITVYNTEEDEERIRRFTIANNLRNIRLSQGMSATELAERAGLSKSAISNYENERSTPKREDLVRIAKTLRVTVYDLLDRNSYKFRSPVLAYDSGKIPYYDNVTFCGDEFATPFGEIPNFNQNGFEEGKIPKFVVQVKHSEFVDLGIPRHASILFYVKDVTPDAKILVVKTKNGGRFARIVGREEDILKLWIYTPNGGHYIVKMPADSNAVLGVAVRAEKII